MKFLRFLLLIGGLSAPACAHAQAQANLQVLPGSPNQLTLSVGANPLEIGSWPTGGLFTPFANVLAKTETGSYAVQAADRGYFITFNSTLSSTATLTSASYTAGFNLYVQNIGTASVVLTPTTGMINGTPTLTLSSGQGVVLVFDGTNYAAMTGFSTASAGVTSVAGLTGAVTANQLVVPLASLVCPQSFSCAKSYASGSNQTTTGTASASSTALTLASALDFANGQGVRVNHAGPANTLGASSTMTITCTGGSGATSYVYTLVAFDAAGGWTVVSTGSVNCASSLTASVYNAMTWTTVSGAVGYAVYGRTSGTQTLLAFSPSAAFNDAGTALYQPVTAPDWMPQNSPPAVGTAVADWLVTSISSGGGTTSLVLANATTTAVSSQTVVHDDTVGLQAWSAAMISANQQGYLNCGTYNISSAVSFSAAVDIEGCGLAPGSTIRIASPTQDGLDFNGSGPHNLRDFTVFGSTGTAEAVSGALVNLTDSAHQLDKITRVQVQYGATCIETVSSTFIYDGLIINCNRFGLLSTNPGDSSVVNSLFPIFQIPGGSISTAIDLNGNPGGFRLNNTKINSAFGGYSNGLAANWGVTDGDLFVVGCSIEGFSIGGVIIASAAGGTAAGNIVVIATEFNAGGIGNARGVWFPSTVSGWVSNITIVGDVFVGLFVGVDLGQSALNAVVGSDTFSSDSTGVAAITGSGNLMIGPMSFTSTTTQFSLPAGTTYSAITTSAPTYP